MRETKEVPIRDISRYVPVLSKEVTVLPEAAILTRPPRVIHWYSDGPGSDRCIETYSDRRGYLLGVKQLCLVQTPQDGEKAFYSFCYDNTGYSWIELYAPLETGMAERRRMFQTHYPGQRFENTCDFEGSADEVLYRIPYTKILPIGTAVQRSGRFLPPGEHQVNTLPCVTIVT